MALTAAQVTQVYKIFGLPQNGVGILSGPIATFDGPHGETYDFTALCTKLDARLAALTTTQLAECVTLLTREAVLATNPIKVADGSGTYVDYKAERATIADNLANVIGFYNLKSFAHELRGQGNRIIR